MVDANTGTSSTKRAIHSRSPTPTAAIGSKGGLSDCHTSPGGNTAVVVGGAVVGACIEVDVIGEVSSGSPGWVDDGTLPPPQPLSATTTPSDTSRSAVDLERCVNVDTCS